MQLACKLTAWVKFPQFPPSSNFMKVDLSATAALYSGIIKSQAQIGGRECWGEWARARGQCSEKEIKGSSFCSNPVLFLGHQGSFWVSSTLNNMDCLLLASIITTWATQRQEGVLRPFYYSLNYCSLNLGKTMLGVWGLLTELTCPCTEEAKGLKREMNTAWEQICVWEKSKCCRKDQSLVQMSYTVLFMLLPVGT